MIFTNLKDLTKEVETRIDITNVLDYLNFRKAKSKDLYFCDIPDHKEKNASFLGYKGQQTWKCQSRCGDGNIYQLWQKFYNVDYNTAVKEVAIAIAGISENDIKIGLTKYEYFLEKTTELNETCKNYLINERFFDPIEINDLKIRSNVYNKDGNKENYLCYPYYIDNVLMGYKIKGIENKKMWIRAVDDKTVNACLFPDNNPNPNTEIFCIVAGEPDYAVFKKQLRENNLLDIFDVRTNLTGEGNIPTNLIKTLKELKFLKEIRIFYDHDEAGKIGSEKLAKHIVDEIEKPVYIYNFPEELPNKTVPKKGYDISDFYKDGFNINDVFNLKRYQFFKEKIELNKDTESYEIERSILNAMFFDNKFILDIIQAKVKGYFFKDYRFREILKFSLEFFDKHNYLELKVLKDEIKDSEILKGLNEIIGAKSIKSITDFEEKIEYIKFEHAKTEALRTKQLIDLKVTTAKSRKELLNELGKIHDNLLLNNIDEKNHYTFTEIADEYINEYLIPEDQLFIKSPWEEVNKHLNPGIEIGMVSLFGAKTSTGKTTAVRQWADYTASQGIHTAMYVTETKKSSIASMTFSHRTNIENYKFRRRDLGENYQDIIKSARKHYDNHLTYIEAFDMTGSEVVEDIRLLKRKDPKLKFVIVDSFHAFDIEKGFSSELMYHNSLIVKFVRLAQKEDIAILLPCHLKRTDNKYTGTGRPTVEDFAGTSNLEKRGNTIFALFLEGTQLMLSILKNRGAERNLCVNLEHEYKYSFFKVAPQKY